MISLDCLGYDDFFDAAFRAVLGALDAAARPSLRPARIVRQERDVWTVHDGDAERPARLDGQLRRSLETHGTPPTVGDWVAADGDAGADALRIHALLPRRSALLRKVAGHETLAQPIAANMDLVLIVVALDGDFSPRRIERYLAAVQSSGASAALVLSKADLAPDLARFRTRLRVPASLPVLPVSALSGAGMDALSSLVFPRRTAVLVGSSGVGKSTLINRLLGRDELATQPVRARDELGQHTTTRRQMLLLPNGALLIDTPGMRELVPWLDEEALDAAFDDIQALASTCRFRDCRHQGEPGCAVSEAIDRGELDPDRLANYDKQLREIRWLERRRDERSARDREVNAKRKAIARFSRELHKRGGKW